MQQIARWDADTKSKKMQMAQQIADHNRQWFFSQGFFDQVTGELKTNLTVALAELDHPDNYKVDYWNQFASTPAVINFASVNQESQWPTKSDIDVVLAVLKNKTQ
jgi:hypothetical protein